MALYEVEVNARVSATVEVEADSSSAAEEEAEFEFVRLLGSEVEIDDVEVEITNEPDGVLRVTRRLTSDDKSVAQYVTLFFEWSGGPYIEVGHVGGTPIEVINVWNYAEAGPGKARIAFTKTALDRKVTEWIEEYGKENLIFDAVVNWSR